MPYYGPEVYYKYLPNGGKNFINSKAILRACGFGLLDIRPKSVINFIHQRIGNPVLNLDYVLQEIVQVLQPLDWETFWEKQVTKKQVLKVIASGLLSEKAVVLSAEDGHFTSLAELTNCMRASMSLPGLTGDAVRLKVKNCSEYCLKAVVSSVIVVLF
jgi:predicted patatin/cPLA2 family phospholipase